MPQELRTSARADAKRPIFGRIGRLDTRCRHAALRPDLPLGDVSLAATRYTRSLPVFSDTRFNPSFLRTTPAKNPRTECGCQPVAFVTAATVAPRPCRSISITRACLESRASDLVNGGRASSLLFLRAVCAACEGVAGVLSTSLCACVPRRSLSGLLRIGLVGRLSLDFVVCLLGDMTGSPFGLATATAPSPPKPRSGDTAGGAGSREGSVPSTMPQQ